MQKKVLKIMLKMITIFGRYLSTLYCYNKKTYFFLLIITFRQYLFFLVHLRNKDPTEYTGPESYIAGCLKDADYSFFPINRALGLDKEKDDTERLDKLEELNQSLLEKLAKLEEHIDKLGDQHLRSRQNSLLLSPL